MIRPAQILRTYIASWVFLIWSVTCFSLGAYIMHQADTKAALAAVHAYFKARGR